MSKLVENVLSFYCIDVSILASTTATSNSDCQYYQDVLDEIIVNTFFKKQENKFSTVKDAYIVILEAIANSRSDLLPQIKDILNYKTRSNYAVEPDHPLFVDGEEDYSFRIEISRY